MPRPVSRGIFASCVFGPGKPLTQARRATRTSKHAGGRDLMPASRAIEPVAAILALRVGEALLLFALWALTVHFAVSDVIFKDQTAFCTNLGIASMIGRLATRRRADKNRVTRIAPVLAAF